MKLVKENIEFERGLEPADAMSIGQKALNRKWLETQDIQSTGDAEFENDVVAIFFDLDTPMVTIANFKTKSVSYMHLDLLQVKYSLRLTRNEFLILSGVNMIVIDIDTGNISEEEIITIN